MPNYNKKIWGGRFQEKTDNLLEQLSTSIHFDKVLAPYDILGSLAHAKMLAQVGLINPEEFKQIESGLKTIQKQIENNQFTWQTSLEDVHMNIEKALTDLIGEAGAKLHTARSRNDQVALDIKLYLKEAVIFLKKLLKDLQTTIVEKAQKAGAAPMPGYTHLQRAQPVLVGHHLMAYYQMLARDYERFEDLEKRLDYMPLGSGALAGTGLAINQEITAKELGFKFIAANSLDAVSSRDHLLEFLAAASILMVHLSRLAEDLILWCSQEFNFATLPDSLSTGSSMMPQKKNPDGAELMRGKSGRCIGNLNTLLIVMKGLPLSYNRDLQEDKEPVFDTVETLSLILPVAEKMIAGLKFNFEAMYQAANDPYAPATDLADFLVKKGLPFRKAHKVAGEAVAYGLKNKKALTELTAQELKNISNLLDETVLEEMKLENMLKARQNFSGTSPESLKVQIKNAKNKLANK